MGQGDQANWLSEEIKRIWAGQWRNVCVCTRACGCARLHTEVSAHTFQACWKNLQKRPYSMWQSKFQQSREWLSYYFLMSPQLTLKPAIKTFLKPQNLCISKLKIFTARSRKSSKKYYKLNNEVLHGKAVRQGVCRDICSRPHFYLKACKDLH